MKSVFILFLFSLIIWGGCSKQENNDQKNANQENVNDKDTDSTAQIFEGIYFSGQQLRKLHLCSRNEDLWVIDSTGGDLDEQYYGLKLGPHQPAYVEIEGEIQPTADPTVRKLIRILFVYNWVDKVEKFKIKLIVPVINCFLGDKVKNHPGQLQ